MISSQLRDRINILEQTITKNEFGQTEIGYQFKYSTRARVNYSSGTRTMDNDEIFYSVDREFIVRSYVPIVDTDIIEWDNEKWRVLTIDKNRHYNNILIRTTKINE